MSIRSIWFDLSRSVRLGATVFLSLFLIGSLFYSKIMHFAIAQNIIFVIHILFAVAIYHSVSGIDASSMRKASRYLGLGLVYFCAMIAVAFVYHPPLSEMPDNRIVWQFIIPGFISVRLFGAFCGAILCFLLTQLLIDDKSQSRRYLPYVFLTACTAMTIWSGTRNAVLGIVAAMAIMFVFYKVRPSGLKSVIALGASLCVATVLAVSLIPHNDEMFMLISSGDSMSAESISGTRASYWAALWEAYKSVPLFGAGPFASFWILPAGAQMHVQPHNILLQFLLAWGLPAAISAISLLGYATWKAHSIAGRHRSVLPFLAMLDCLLVMSFFDGMAHFAQPLMMLMICFGVIFSATKDRATTDRAGAASLPEPLLA